jgi:Metallo-peptidase family M12
MQRALDHRVALLVAGLLVASASTLVAQQRRGLFTDAGGASVAADRQPAGDRTRVRSRTVKIELPQLGTRATRPDSARQLLLNLFDDASYQAILDRIDLTRSGFVWVGHIPGIAMSTVTLATEDGVMYGSILTPAGAYVIRSAGNGLHTIAELDQSAFSPEAEAREVDAPAAPGIALADAPIPEGDDSADFVDVMMLYTPAAGVAAGGTAAMNALIANAISVTNTSYANSNVTQRLRLAYSGPVAYTESGDIETDLDNVTNGTGSLAGVAALRNTYSADVVSLLTNTPGSAFCGIAWHMSSVSSGFESFAYSVVEQSCAVGSLAFPHELGHNMGLRHDWYVDNRTTPYSYAHGHVNLGASAATRWRTIMSYADKCTDQGVFCTRIPYWSNPSLTYMGSPLGVPAGTNTSCTLRNRNNPACDADEHLVLNGTALTVANFRKMALSVASMTPDVTFPVPASSSVTWTVSATGGTSPYTYKFFVYDGTQWLVGRDWGASNVWTWTPGLAGTYSFQVWVRNAGSTATTYDAWLGVGPLLVTGPAALSMTALSPNVTFPVTVNTPITWTAEATGGTGPYTYKFWVSNGSSWSLGQDWSASNSWVWKPAVAGPYSFQVWARNAGSAADPFDAWRPAGPVSISAPPGLTVTTVSPSLSSPVSPGSHVTWTASASGGTGPYTYKFWVHNRSSWSVGQDWSSSSAWTWTPAAPGTYNFQIWARNAGSLTTFDAWCPAGPFDVNGPPPLALTSFTANQAFPVPANTPVTWTATSSGGNGPYTYKFWVYDGAAWTLGRDWGTANTFDWTPSIPGTYSFQVWARNIGSVATYDAWGGFGPYIVTVPGPLAVTGFTADRAFPVPAGTPVTWTAVARGGFGPYTYRFWVNDGSTWTLGQDWSASPTWTWIPPAAGTYSFQLWVRNVGSASAFDEWRPGGPVTVGAPATLSVTNVAMSPGALIVGTPASFNVTAAGGTGLYTYKLWVYDGSAWSVAQDWSAGSTLTWVPASSGTYSFQVWVRNSGSASLWDAWAPVGPFTAAADRR